MMWQQPQPVVKIATNALDSLFEGVHLSCAPQHAAANACIGVDIRLVAVEFSGRCLSACSIYAW